MSPDEIRVESGLSMMKALEEFIRVWEQDFSPEEIEEHNDVLAQILEFWEEEDETLALLCMAKAMLHEILLVRPWEER